MLPLPGAQVDEQSGIEPLYDNSSFRCFDVPTHVHPGSDQTSMRCEAIDPGHNRNSEAGQKKLEQSWRKILKQLAEKGSRDSSLRGRCGDDYVALNCRVKVLDNSVGGWRHMSRNTLSLV